MFMMKKIIKGMKSLFKGAFCIVTLGIYNPNA